MQQILGITNQPNQQLTLSLPDGSILTLSILYRQSQSGWFFTSINWNNGQFIENGRRIVTHPNMLRQYLNEIPFGLACQTVNDREPTQQEDFSSQVKGTPAASGLFLLSADEVKSVETFIQSLKNA